MACSKPLGKLPYQLSASALAFGFVARGQPLILTRRCVRCRVMQEMPGAAESQDWQMPEKVTLAWNRVLRMTFTAPWEIILEQPTLTLTSATISNLEA